MPFPKVLVQKGTLWYDRSSNLFSQLSQSSILALSQGDSECMFVYEFVACLFGFHDISTFANLMPNTYLYNFKQFCLA